MDIKKILEYQDLDRGLFKIEKELRKNDNKQLANENYKKVKDSQANLVKFEAKAGELFTEIEKVKKQFKVQENKMNEVMNKDVETLSQEEVEELSVLKDKLRHNLNVLDKNLTILAENVNAVLSNFNKTLKILNASKEQYIKSKAEFDKDVKLVEDDKNSLIKKLNELAKNIDVKIMEEYLKCRNENKFPVVVPLQDNCCGGCHMELPYASISKLENGGALVCEHCHRIIYKK